ncbi:MAG TPA: hypothetical protein VK363_02740 [Pyrinomonadaceae bacterium]|nr:hypothetical protein [Pyrinomonadaceae bacterium]
MNHTCPVQLAENCTTPGWDSSCPYGTYPNNGMCCSSGGCNGLAASPDAWLAFERINIADKNLC